MCVHVNILHTAEAAGAGVNIAAGRGFSTNTQGHGRSQQWEESEKCQARPWQGSMAGRGQHAVNKCGRRSQY